MGRPPLKANGETMPTMIRMTREMRDEIAGHVGSSGVAEFIRAAVEKELRRLRRAAKRKPDA